MPECGVCYVRKGSFRVLHVVGDQPHVLCVECTGRLSSQECPFCRAPLQPSPYVVEVDLMRCGHVQWLVDTRRYGFCANSAVLGDNYCALHGGQPSSPPLVIDLTGSSNPAAGSSNPAAGSSNPAAGSSNPAAGSSNPAAGSSNPAAGSSNPAAGSSNPAAGSSNPVPVIDLTEDDPVTEDDPMTDDDVCSMCSDEDDE